MLYIVTNISTKSKIGQPYLKQQIYMDNSDHWYQYKVPLIKWGTGRLIKISERKYKRLKRWCYFSRSFIGETAFLIFMLLFFIVMTVLKACIDFI